ncbi:MAG: SGNH/GDSL hydrolase family protein [Anaerolineae bacterium]|nr:SGNH/GDSL hydrolase family protein [Anaerolineae bacterium]
MKRWRAWRWLLLPAALLAIVPLAAQRIPEETMPAPGGFTTAILQSLDRIYATGQAYGQRPDVFAKVGDSITVSRAFFAPFGEGDYNLAEYSPLQPVIDYYSRSIARTGNSFVNESLAAGVGWSASAALDPAMGDTALCAGELPLLCEYRLTRPAVALIMFGTNDVGYVDPQLYRRNMERIVSLSIDQGVIPILSTIPVRAGLEGKSALYNAILVDITAEAQLPLWDYATAMQALPGAGLGSDGVHPSAPSWNYRATADFSPALLRYGYTLRNLTGLQMLYRLWDYLQSKQ